MLTMPILHRFRSGSVFARMSIFMTALGLMGILASKSATASTLSGRTAFMYVGTYARANGEGIYLYAFDSGTGGFTARGLAAKTDNPSFMVSDPRQHFLYAVSEVGNDGRVHGSISSFSIDRITGALHFLNKVDSAGGGPCHLAVDHTGRFLFVANYGTGNVAAFSIAENGSIGDMTGSDQHSGASIDPIRQTGPHAHAVAISPDNRYLLATDLGNDKVFTYRFNATNGMLASTDPGFVSVGAGLGPRHLAFNAKGNFLYLLCEMGSSVVAFSYDHADARLKAVQTISTLSSGYSGKDNSAEVALAESGRYLYASNRGEDSIAVFRVDRRKGTLTKIQTMPTQGRTPRSFVLDPTGSFMVVADQDSDRVVAFAVGKSTGRLTPAGSMATVPGPVCILFIPQHR